MNDHQVIEVPLSNGGHIRLMFKQFQANGDWICLATDECMTDMVELLENDSVIPS